MNSDKEKAINSEFEEEIEERERICSFDSLSTVSLGCLIINENNEVHKKDDEHVSDETPKQHNTFVQCEKKNNTNNRRTRESKTISSSPNVSSLISLLQSGNNNKDNNYSLWGHYICVDNDDKIENK